VGANSFCLVRGHDFVVLLHKLLREPWGRRITPVRFARVEEHDLRRWLVLSTHPTDVDALPTAAALVARFGPPM
jgi:hypothetical protein